VALRPVTPTAGVVLAPNPGPMTLEGTNTWVLRAPGAASAVVVDPGPWTRGTCRPWPPSDRSTSSCSPTATPTTARARAAWPS
jgi:glyoxylase-like metal-dependent hydrolase (beta-lactamase superfamily II)